MSIEIERTRGYILTISSSAPSRFTPSRWSMQQPPSSPRHWKTKEKPDIRNNGRSGRDS